MVKVPKILFYRHSFFGRKMEKILKVLLFSAKCGSIITVADAVYYPASLTILSLSDCINKRMLFEERMS